MDSNSVLHIFTCRYGAKYTYIGTSDVQYTEYEYNNYRDIYDMNIIYHDLKIVANSNFFHSKMTLFGQVI